MSRSLFARLGLFSAFILSLAVTAHAAPQKRPKTQDVIVLTNGDTLHGTFLRSVNGTVIFQSGPLGELHISWTNIKELHTAQPFAVLKKSSASRQIQSGQLPTGRLTLANQVLSVKPMEPDNQAGIAKIPLKNVRIVTSLATLHKQLGHQQGFFQGWNGSATAGASLVTATENQYTITAGVSLDRIAPTVSWLRRRNNTQFDFTASYGKITRPAYYDASGTLIPAAISKTAIYHLDGERDQYFSPRFFALAQTAFDHNYSQNLQLQQVYGAGIGWTAFKTHRQEVDLKATVQYEKQHFISSTGNSNPDQNLIGSTFAANYALHLKPFTFLQNLSYVTAYNNPTAYSAYETNKLIFPAWKNLAFSVGTSDSYLNFIPISYPPTRHNSFQFIMGLTYAFHSAY
ncbi:MAG: DUF481 domain-containing protein [Acidobacteriaceae bacterium]